MLGNATATSNGMKPVALLQARWKHLTQERASWDSHWKEIAEFLIPRKGMWDGQQPNKGEKKNAKIINGTATSALRIAAAGLHGGLTSPSTPWFRMGISNKELQETGDVRMWLADCEQKLYWAFSRSNFYAASHTLYTDLLSMGTGVMFQMEDPKSLLRYYNLTTGEYSLAAGWDQRVNTCYRNIWLTAMQLVEKFGYINCPKAVREAWDNNAPFQWFKVLHAIEPRVGRDPQKVDNKNMPFRSAWCLADGDEFIEDSGYWELPFVAVRWDTSGGDVYGRGPGMDTLGDCKMLQEMERTSIKQIHKITDPPMLAPRNLMANLNLLPGAINLASAGEAEAIRPVYQINPDIKACELKIQAVSERIKQDFFNDVFLSMIERPNMTATEVVERHEEKLMRLGPLVDRMQGEYLEPTIERAFYILVRQGLISEPPKSMQGEQVRVEYVSMLAQAQKAIASKTLDRFVSFLTQVVNLKSIQDAEILDVVDLDAMIVEWSNLEGVPPRAIRSQDVVIKIREARNQAHVEAAAAQGRREDALAMTTQARDLGSVQTQGGTSNAAADLMGALQIPGGGGGEQQLALPPAGQMAMNPSPF